MADFKFSVAGGIFTVGIMISTVMAFVDGRLGDISNEAGYVVLVLSMFFSKPKKYYVKAGQIILDVLDRFSYMLLPMAILISALSLSDIRAGGDEAYFFGHWLGICVSVSTYLLLTGRSWASYMHTSTVVIAGSWLILTIFLCLASFQSFHLLIIGLAILVALVENVIEGRTLGALACAALLLSFVAFILSVLAFSDSTSWINLKAAQIVGLWDLSGGDNNNSLIIRLSQLISILEQGSLANIIIGNGVASTYLADGAFWDEAIFHETTYPADELASGVLQYIHETPVMILKWSGFAGLIIWLFAVWKNLKGGNLPWGAKVMIMICYIMLATASLHTAILVTALVIFGGTNEIKQKLLSTGSRQ